ncbi:MAG: DHH family phosphoesterase [Candidatus Bathyarchaeota archaeon]|nr:DHH family phosphoesterase [Candidatus Bathyarchaeota archaeon]
MPEEDFFNSFNQAVSIFNKHIEQGSFIRLVTHNDADGLSSGGIMASVAIRRKARFKISSEKKLDDKLIARLVEEKPDLIIFSDFGSGYLDIIAESLKQDIIVLDHHLPMEYEAENIVHINPMLHEIDGARAIAASGVCYFFAKAIDPEYKDLACLGILGALGDQQDKGERKSLIGLNKIIEAEAVENHLLEKHVGLIFYGYETRPVAKAIAYTTIPYIPGLSGNEGNCVAFLKEIGIEILDGDKLRALADLSDDEKTRLFSALSNHMVSSGCSSDSIHQLIGTIYTFKLEEPSTPLRSGREYGSLLNACGRMDKQGVGLSVAIGDREEAMDEAQETLELYRRTIGEALDWVQMNDKVEEMDHIYVIKAMDQINDTVIGVVSGILLSQGILKEKKPIIATAVSEEDQLKVSARGLEELVEQGIHMGKIMQEAAEQVEGGGGGHDIAAGAYIPAKGENKFLREVDRLVGMFLEN